MHICNLSSLFIKFLHMFLLPDVVSAAIADVAFIQIILSLFMTYHIYIYIACINIYSYM